MIRKLPNQNQWRLYSRSLNKNGKRKILGTFLSYEDALKRERQIQYFKHRKNPKCKPLHKNPIPFSPDNLRRWSIKNFPELMKNENLDRDFNLEKEKFNVVKSEARKYFNIFDQFANTMAIRNFENVFYKFNIRARIQPNQIETVIKRYEIIIKENQDYEENKKFYIANLFELLLIFFINVYFLIFSSPFLRYDTKLKYWNFYMSNWDTLDILSEFMQDRFIGSYFSESTIRHIRIKKWNSLTPLEKQREISQFLQKHYI